MANENVGEKKKVTVDVHEFVRTRDALTSAYMSLSSSIDRAVKAYIDHTNVVLAGDASLDVSMLQQPFHDIAAPQLAQLALAHQQQDAQAAVPPTDADGKKKRNYKPRDPNAPKRPLTAYFRYLQEQRAPLAEQMAKINDAPSKPGDISKAATERWKSMSEEEQAPYKAAYQRALKDYEREVANYKAGGGEGAEPAEQQQVNGAAQQDDDDAESETDSEESSEEEEAKPMPPPAPKVASPEVKKTPKSAMKKSKKDVKPAEDFPATPQFSSINPSVPIPSSQQKSSSPELKRKASGDAAEEGTKKKRGRKTKAEKEAEAAAAAAAAAAPAVPASDASSEKPKKEKKKKRKSEA